MSLIYVTGHRNPDTDSIASAIGYAELKRRLDPRQRVRPGAARRASTPRRAGCSSAAAPPEPDFLPHVMLRVRDVMRESFPSASHREPVREVGLTMAREDLDLVPIVDDDGALAGVMTERALARRYIRESREASSLADAADRGAGDRRASLEGELVAGEEREITGRVWVLAMDVASLPGGIATGDVVVVGDRPTPSAARSSSASRCWSPATARAPSEEVLALAREHGTTVVSSPLDSYVTSRMVTLVGAVPGAHGRRAADRRAPTTCSPTSPRRSRTSHYRAAVAVDGAPAARSGWSPAPTSSTRSRAASCSSTTPSRRRACPASSRPRSSRSSTTTTSARSRRTVPVHRDLRPGRLDRDARDRALPPERHGAQPADGDAAARRGPVGHGDPQLADDDRARPRGGRVPRARARRSTPTEFGREMFEETSDVVERRRPTRSSAATPRSTTLGERPDDLHRPDRDGRRRRSLERRDELLEALRRRRASATDYRSVRADGHRHPRQGHRAARRRRPRAARARLRRSRRTTACSSCPA